MWLTHQRLGHPLFQILKCIFMMFLKGFLLRIYFVMSEKEQNIRDIPIAPNIQREENNHSNLFIVMYGILLYPQIFMVLNGS